MLEHMRGRGILMTAHSAKRRWSALFYGGISFLINITLLDMREAVLMYAFIIHQETYFVIQSNLVTTYTWGLRRFVRCIDRTL